jgi:transketolase
MRNTFVDTMTAIAEEDPNVWLLCGDLGFSVLEKFALRFKERYLNVGVAEQNMAGIAAGLALSGKMVFVYSIANFPSIRCLEQIRNDVCYHGASVAVVSVGGGFAYGSAGYTHHALEDVAVDLTDFLNQRDRDYCICMISSRWWAEGANVCGAGGL